MRDVAEAYDAMVAVRSTMSRGHSPGSDPSRRCADLKGNHPPAVLPSGHVRRRVTLSRLGTGQRRSPFETPDDDHRATVCADACVRGSEIRRCGAVIDPYVSKLV